MSASEPTLQGDEPATSYAPAEEGPLAHVGALLLFDAPLDRSDLLAAVARAARMHPVLRSRPTRVPLAADLLAWVPEPDFRLARHVRQVDAGDARGVARAASTVWSQPLPASRPPWRVDLLSGPDDAGIAVVVRGHAALAPGGDGATLAATVLGATPADEPPRGSEPAPGDAQKRGSSPRSVLLDAAIALAERGARSSRALASEVRGFLRPGVALARTLELGRVLESAGTLLSSPAPETPWNRSLGTERTVAWLTLPRDALRGAVDEAGHAWQDAWLAVVADALGRLLRARGRDTNGLTLLAHVPALRADAEEGPLLVGLPVGEMSPAARVAAVGRNRLDPVAAARGTGLARLASVAERLPEPLASLLGSLCYQAANVVVATHAAPSAPIVVAGRTASLVVPLASLPWHVGLVLEALVGDDALVVGVTADAASLPSAEEVTRALQAAHVELAAAAGGPSAGLHAGA